MSIKMSQYFPKPHEPFGWDINVTVYLSTYATKTDIKIKSNKIKPLLVENELKKLKTFDSIYFRGKSHFKEDGMQNYLVLQPIKRHFKVIASVGNSN